jgi:hypothetical protein
VGGFRSTHGSNPTLFYELDRQASPKKLKKAKKLSEPKNLSSIIDFSTTLRTLWISKLTNVKSQDKKPLLLFQVFQEL